MSKKKEMKKIFDNLDLESSDVHGEVTGSARENAQQVVPELGGAEDELAGLQAEMMAAEQEEPSGQPADQEQPAGQEPAEVAAPEEGPDLVEAESEEAGMPSTEPGETPGPASAADSPDDLLEDVRKSLLEEEAQGGEQQPKWWQRIGRSSRKKQVEEETPSVPEEVSIPALAAVPAAEAAEDEYQEQIDELIDLLDQEDEPVEADLVPSSAGIEVVPEPEPEKPVDIEELKKQAFEPRPAEQAQSDSDVRAIALEGEEEVFVEVEAKRQDPLEERLDAVENALKPYRRYINFGFAFLGVIMAAIAMFLIYNAYQRSVVQNAPTPLPSNLPYPTSVSLPGGWQFTLGKGSLTSEGSWNPGGAEWLQGTEVCRWVALPWSRQLEAVVRTLNTEDSIELGMSNNDKLTYNVYSIKQMSPAEMRELDSNSPCLLIVLAEPGAEKRWVLTSLP